MMRHCWWMFGMMLVACSGPATPDPDMVTMPDAGVDVSDMSDDLTADTSEDIVEQDMEPPAPQVYPIEDCDPLMPSRCSLPWPSNLYLAPDDDRATGYTLRFGSKSLPRNKFGRWPDPAPFERLDGYGLGSPVQLHLPGLDLSELAGEDSIGRSLEPNAPIVWLQVRRGAPPERIPYFVERDLLTQSPEDALVFVRPGVLLHPDARQVIALRGLKTQAGDPIPASDAFDKLRRSDTEDEPTLAPRQARFDKLFDLLDAQGIDRASLTLAWDFHTASTQGLHGDMVHMRDEAFSMLDGEVPIFEVVRVQEFVREEDGSGKDVNEHIALEVDLTFEAPHYMKPRGTGFEFQRDAQGRPALTGTRTVETRIRVPWRALSGAPQGVILYGHGLFGDVWEVRQGYLGLIANRDASIIVGLNLVGMSDEDASAAQDTVLSLAEFVKVADRLHQGILEHLIMARYAQTMLASLEEITKRGVLMDGERTRYMGASQGGIFGGTILALSPDVDRGVLVVPGHNYAVMLHRSVNFDQFQEGLEAVFEDDVELAMIPALLQLLWDGTEQTSYLRHLVADPLPGNNPKEALFLAARGDQQVSVLTNEIMSRSRIGIPIVGVYDDERTPWDVPTVGYPHTGSGLVLVDLGNPWPAVGNLPPMTELPDPHGRIEEFEGAGALFLHYLNTGEMLDQCSDAPCQGSEAK